MARALGVKRADVDRTRIKARGLAEFTRLAWPHVIPTEMQWSWHHDLVCSKLEALWRREIRKLSIWIPPGTTKTLLTGVFGPAWVWTFDPERISCNATYGGPLALKSARRMRDLVNSDWYQALVGGTPKILYPGSLAAAYFENNKKGARFSGSVGGEITGNHFMDIAGDDLNKAMEGRSLSGLGFEASWQFWSGDLSTRQAEPSLTTKLQIGQRLHVDDVGGRWVRDDPEVEILCLPMRYEADHPYVCPDDPRSEGELLWPDRFDDEAVAEMERRLGPSQAAAQLQQRPIPPGGQLLRTAYLSRRYDRLPGRLQGWLEGGQCPAGAAAKIYGDMTFKGKATSDYVVYQFWVAYQGLLYCVDQVRGQWGFRESKQRLLSFRAAHPQASAVLLEDAANAPAIVDDLAREIPGLGLAPMQGGCLARTQQAEGVWASEVVHLPAGAAWVGGSDGFEAEHLSYDGLGTRHDDQVATSSLAILDLSSGSAQAYNSAWKAVLNG